ncbi:MAG: oligopeptidase B, partial [Chitinophagales bacterium]|nr:oligopeptidase B [Chitinophagales bacterium]
MHRNTFFALILSTTLTDVSYCQTSKEGVQSPAIDNITPPVAQRIPHEIHNDHGGVRIDYYYWMRDRNDKKVTDYLTAENLYVDSALAHTKPLQQKLFNEMKNRIKEDESSVPYKKGEYYYYTRYEEGGEYPIYCRKKNKLDNPEEIIIDGYVLGKNEPFLNFYVEMSPDQKMVCVIADTRGRN